MIVLYSNNCPACKVLKSKLDAKNIEYELVQDEKTLVEKGFDWLPIMDVDGKLMKVAEASKYIDTL